MPRVTSGVTTHARHKKVIKAAKGYYGRRKNRKRNFRALWIQRINAGCRAIDETLTYSRFINGLNLAVQRHEKAPHYAGLF